MPEGDARLAWSNLVQTYIPTTKIEPYQDEKVVCGIKIGEYFDGSRHLDSRFGGPEEKT